MVNAKARIVTSMAGVAMIMGCAVAVPSSSETPASTEPTRQVNPLSTKDYLASLPKWRREQVLMAEEMRKAQELRRNSGKQVIQWIQDTTPVCLDWFGTDNCYPYVLQMENIGPCGWEAVRRIPWEEGDELDSRLAYFAFLGNDRGELAGDSFFYTTPESGGRVISLDMVRCWEGIDRFPKRARIN